MDKEILFRGKRVDNGKWVYGGCVHQTDWYGDKVDKYFIIDGLATRDYDIGYIYEVDEDTIGQFTGKTDKNGNKIFEGDIVEYEFDEIGEQKAIIYWNFDYAGFLLNPLDNFQFTKISDGIIVGNIYDNPQLLEAQDGSVGD